MQLPPPDQAAEDQFVLGLGDAEEDVLVEVVEKAMEARRPGLAARIVGLLPDAPDAEEGSHLARAKRAAAMLLVRGADAPERSFDLLEEAWAEVRRRRVRRMKARIRRFASERPSTERDRRRR